MQMTEAIMNGLVTGLLLLACVGGFARVAMSSNFKMVSTVSLLCLLVTAWRIAEKLG
jgi:hypothetical protein